MAFVTAKRPVAAAPIKVFVNGADGTQVEIGFVAQYHRHAKTHVDSLLNGMINRRRKIAGDELVKNPDGSTPDFPFETDADFIRAKMAGWLHVKNEGGSLREFTDEALVDVMEDFPEIVSPLFNGFFEAHSGAKQKN